jgi:uncharacterized protein (UPF0332 family)
MLNLNFVKPGRLDVSTARLLLSLQKYREAADYNEAYVADPQGTSDDLARARAFVQSVAGLLPK